jgi:catechol 2,3-dioxygenase-like lactoylglutathione lyase family enzyme
MELRVARHTGQLKAVTRFYRDGIGLVEMGRFRDHDGYDGVFLGVPGTGAHLEFTSGAGRGAPEPDPESLLVFYVGDGQAVDEISARLGIDPVCPENPYWAEHGVTFLDPDGHRVVLVGERG